MVIVMMVTASLIITVYGGDDVADDVEDGEEDAAEDHDDCGDQGDLSRDRVCGRGDDEDGYLADEADDDNHDTGAE
eukprot:9292-Eustigmatos_ZCMA.PRE.1